MCTIKPTIRIIKHEESLVTLFISGSKGLSSAFVKVLVAGAFCKKTF